MLSERSTAVRRRGYFHCGVFSAPKQARAVRAFSLPPLPKGFYTLAIVVPLEMAAQPLGALRRIHYIRIPENKMYSAEKYKYDTWQRQRPVHISADHCVALRGGASISYALARVPLS